MKRTLYHGLFIPKSTSLSLCAYKDASWACNLDDRRSITAHCVFLGHLLISWSSKKQHVIEWSSTESEYRSLANIVVEISWLQALLTEIQFCS